MRAAALIVALAVAVACNPTPSPTPSVPEATPSGPQAEVPWITGQDLMDTLSEQYGTEWIALGQISGVYPSPGELASPIGEPTSYASRLSEPVMVEVHQPINAAATVRVASAVNVWAADGSQEARRVALLLAPEAATWLVVAAEETLQTRATQSFTTANGGHVSVDYVDEEQLADWIQVSFSPPETP